MEKEIKNIKMGAQKCESCGGNLEIDLDKRRAVCPYCRTEYIIEEEKKTAVESVIGFIEKQQKMKQNKEEAEAKKREEARIKQKEDFEKNKWKYLIGGICFALVISIICIVGIISENAEKKKNLKAGKIEVPASYEDLKGKNYEDVEKKFEKAGFTNVKSKALGDMITGLLSDEGDVDKVSIDGDTEFSSSDFYKKDVKVVIRYHSYPKKDDSKIESKKETKKETKKEDKVGDKKEDSDEIITVDNNELFKKIVNSESPDDKDVEKFSEKYFGRTVEFDGNISYLTYDVNENKYIFDMLINTLDYDAERDMGPTFRFDDCNGSQIGYKYKEPIPFETGDNIKVVGSIMTYDKDRQILDLYPLKITKRKLEK